MGWGRYAYITIDWAGFGWNNEFVRKNNALLWFLLDRFFRHFFFEKKGGSVYVFIEKCYLCAFFDFVVITDEIKRDA